MMPLLSWLDSQRAAIGCTAEYRLLRLAMINLSKGGIKSVEEFQRTPDKALRQLPWVGEVSVSRVRNYLPFILKAL